MFVKNLPCVAVSALLLLLSPAFAADQATVNQAADSAGSVGNLGIGAGAGLGAGATAEDNGSIGGGAAASGNTTPPSAAIEAEAGIIGQSGRTPGVGIDARTNAATGSRIPTGSETSEPVSPYARAGAGTQAPAAGNTSTSPTPQGGAARASQTGATSGGGTGSAGSSVGGASGGGASGGSASGGGGGGGQ